MLRRTMKRKSVLLIVTKSADEVAKTLLSVQPFWRNPPTPRRNCYLTFGNFVASQISASLAIDPLASFESSGETAIVETRVRWPGKVAISFSDRMSQTRIFPSNIPPINLRLSFIIANQDNFIPTPKLRFSDVAMFQTKIPGSSSRKRFGTVIND